MGPTIIAALFGLIGIALGGGMRAWESNWARQREAEGVLSALCAEVEAVNRLADHRSFLAGFHQCRAANAELVASGHGDGPGQWLVIDLTHNYFSTYEALNSKLGLLHPYFADRIARFYTYAKAVTENYRVDSPFHANLTASAAVEALDNDIMLLQTVHILGVHIASFRKADAPTGVVDPFPAIAAGDQQTREQAIANAREPLPPQVEGPSGLPGG
ncbi:hypothetical protein [Sphingomonas bacterium]|uniref:hypothetical protein n=1 Tax=Sphingomonas bacterium TaxID=1895847 RepID=UPI002611E6B4|nr:hypothetical protein [Sphingomonas bacterium]MDB5678994.1 hypothetical protein [Sphingomonas bacterium]